MSGSAGSAAVAAFAVHATCWPSQPCRPDGGTGGDVFAWLFYVFVAWALVLLVIGVRTVHGWSWLRSLAGVGTATLIVAGLALGVSLLYALS